MTYISVRTLLFLICCYFLRNKKQETRNKKQETGTNFLLDKRDLVYCASAVVVFAIG
jgi:hypothetical protein